LGVYCFGDIDDDYNDGVYLWYKEYGRVRGAQCTGSLKVNNKT
jgi:hypothetical protein